MIRVLIAEENPVLELGLRSLLKGIPEIDIVGDAGLTDSGVWRLAEWGGDGGPDLVLLGSAPPTAADRVRELVRARPGVRIVLLTSSQEPCPVLRTLAAGAHSCLLYGDFEPPELRKALLVTARGESYLSPPVAGALVTWLHGDGARVVRRDGARLTSRESEIMDLIAEGLTNREIADRLVISGKTVKNHAHSIYKRLGAENRALAVSRWNDLKARI